MKLGLIATVQDAPELLRQAQQAVSSATDVVMDCSTATKCDIALLEVLIALRVALARHGHALHVTGASGTMAWQLELVGLGTASSA